MGAKTKHAGGGGGGGGGAGGEKEEDIFVFNDTVEGPSSARENVHSISAKYIMQEAVKLLEVLGRHKAHQATSSWATATVP
jgi:hypothetical protein